MESLHRAMKIKEIKGVPLDDDGDEGKTSD
jgi:hypothetical protein